MKDSEQYYNDVFGFKKPWKMYTSLGYDKSTPDPECVRSDYYSSYIIRSLKSKQFNLQMSDNDKLKLLLHQKFSLIKNHIQNNIVNDYYRCPLSASQRTVDKVRGRKWALEYVSEDDQYPTYKRNLRVREGFDLNNQNFDSCMFDWHHFTDKFGYDRVKIMDTSRLKKLYNFVGSTFRKSFFDLSLFINCDFSYVDFSNSFFNIATFINCDFTGASFNNSLFVCSKFRDCDLTHSYHAGSHFIKTKFDESNINYASMKDTVIDDYFETFSLSRGKIKFATG